MARTTSDIVIDAAPSDVMAVIADFDAYPSWATGVRSAEVVEPGAAGDRADRVRFTLDAAPIRDTYELLYTWDGDRSVSWSLAEKATVLTALDGTYALAEVAGGTRVTYQLAVDVAVPLLGTLKRKAEKVIIDAALSGLKQRVETLG
ncbi:SRPBCC family protein [Aeromicrobium sp. 50.2.37]|uniref:SRPBCC family protein n=1 Tax=Aeromicrobium sp. 50.2.37 TaxID=2969305 RepID=UPI0021503197|nr:SRPBCC family protein [Aeromicrobium sp. 50.2.37]MCR4512224.1 SRPBCC family protein [Aeromicrobium sp. 50.2.37]